MINYEMALSEIEMYKKAHESLSENLTQANKKAQQFKAERDRFEKMLNKECECGYKLEGQLHDMTKQRDTLIDDLSWYKAKVSRLEHENERLKERNYQLAKINDRLYLDNYNLEQENEKQLDSLQDFSKFINYKLEVSPASDTYKHYRSELDKLGVK